MIKNLFMSVLLAIAVSAQATIIERTLVYDDFNRAEVGSKYVLQGDHISMDNNMLKIACPADDTSAREAAFGGTTMTKALHSMDVDSLVWTVNMRHNYGNQSDKLSGFDKGMRGIATILAGTQASITSGSGYAIICGGNSKQQFRLAKFTDGVNGQSRFTDVIEGTDYTTDEKSKYYFTFRVVYVPATDTWKMYEYADASAFVAPSAVTAWTSHEPVVDNTYTDKVCGNYFFLQNYGGTKTFNVWFDNFSLKSYKETPVVANTVYYDDFSTDESINSYTKTDNVSRETSSGTTKNTLKMACPKDNSDGRNYAHKQYSKMTGWLKKQGADSLVWQVNVRHNFGDKELSGFDGGQRGIAIVLASTQNDVTGSSGSGYALINGGNSKYQWRLAKYTDGIRKTEKFTDIILGNEYQKSEAKDYFALRVVYVPATNTWTMYEYKDASAFVDPASVTAWTAHASVVDETYTNKELNKFFFLQNYSGNSTFNVWFDNFSLTYYASQITLDEAQDNAPVLEAMNGKTACVTLTRTLYSDAYNTLCLPFDMSAEQMEAAFGAGYSFKKLTEATMEGETLNLNFEDANKIVAGDPYLFQPAADITTPIEIDNVVIKNETNPKEVGGLVSFTGVLSPTELTGEDESTLILGGTNTLYKPKTTSNMKGMRAYFTLLGGAQVAARFCATFDKTSPTQLKDVNDQFNANGKMMQDGKLIIIREGVRYNAQGQIIK